MTRFKLLAKIVVFISTGLFLAGRLFGGTLSYYIHPRFNGLVGGTAIVLILVGIIYAVQHRQQLLTGMNEDHHDHPHEHDSDHPHSHDLSWLGLSILMIPVILGIMIQPKPLGAPALDNRDVSAGALSSAKTPGSSKLAFTSDSGERNILEWLYLFQTSKDASDFDGQQAKVVGFVYRDDRFLDSQFLVSRFTVSCCVADAFPVGLIVQWPDTPDLLDDEWVEVTGRFEERDFAGYSIPVLIADTVSKTAVPSEPYLYQ